MLVLTDKGFLKQNPYAQIEAAKSFGYDAVAMRGEPDASVLAEIEKAGLKLYTMPDLVVDPAKTSALAEMLRTASAIRLYDYGFAGGRKQNRRLGQGVIDWTQVFAKIAELSWQGDYIMDVDPQGNPSMEFGRSLAQVSRDDFDRLSAPHAPIASWHVVSPEAEGLHTVISPEGCDCLVSNVLRLNLSAGKEFTLESGKLEMNAVLMKGKAHVKHAAFDEDMDKLDSFYMPGGNTAVITAQEDCVFYIAAAVCEGYGKPFFRKLDLSIPIGKGLHQMHGSGSGLREVFFTLDPESASSRLLCGVTWSQDGQWTSWPPHQHEKDLEEVYCYFDMDAPHLGFHGSYLKSSGLAYDGTLHPVMSGHMVLAPRGYHPTVSSPGTKNAYLWVLTSFSHEQRRYDLSVNDPYFDN